LNGLLENGEEEGKTERCMYHLLLRETEVDGNIRTAAEQPE